MEERTKKRVENKERKRRKSCRGQAQLNTSQANMTFSQLETSLLSLERESDGLFESTDSAAAPPLLPSSIVHSG